MLRARGPIDMRHGSHIEMRILSSFVRGALVVAALATSTEAFAQAKAAAEKPAEPPPLPPASARLWLIAPTALGPWTLRIENEGSIAVRIPADGRLLRMEVQANEDAKPVTCTLPSSIRPSGFPEDRALLLAPGYSYEESFDPHLFCFGKSAEALGPNATVRARFGWDPPKTAKTTIKPKKPKPPTGPFAIESTEREPTIAPLWELRAPAILLGSATVASAAPLPPVTKEGPEETKPAVKEGENSPLPETKESNGEATKPPVTTAPPVDERAGKLELSSTGFIEASTPRGVTITVTAKNVGLRPMTVALRPWMLSFRIDGPGGETEMCYADNARRVLPRDAYRPLAPGASTSFTLLLAEVCPRNVFPKPGLYRVKAMMAAKETANGVDIQTTSLTAREPSFIRLAGAAEPFYADPPKATAPTPVVQDAESE